MTNYQIAKGLLGTNSRLFKVRFRNDNAAIRQAINIKAHELANSCKLTEHKTNLLHRYACELHPK